MPQKGVFIVYMNFFLILNIFCVCLCSIFTSHSHSVGFSTQWSTYLLGSSFNATQIPWIHVLFIPSTSCYFVAWFTHTIFFPFFCLPFYAHQKQTLYSLIRVCWTQILNSFHSHLVIRIKIWCVQAWVCVCLCVNHNSKKCACE